MDEIRAHPDFSIPRQLFVGRARLISQIASDVESAAKGPLVISGEPGIGKTALVSELGARLSADVIHYCSRRQGSSIEPTAFSRSFSSQLASRLPGFTNCLANQLDPTINISVIQTVTDSPGSQISAVSIGNLAAQSWSAHQAFEQLVKAPLSAWCALNPTRRIVVIIDAIDEAHNSSISPNIF